MLLLSFEASAKTASVALSRDGELMAEYFSGCGLTHSKTLLPMAEDLLKNCGVGTKNLDAVAVSVGPGSFTGIRIGVSTVKGLCWGADIPAIGVSTLEAMAWQGECAPENAIICCAMDARRNQVYNALFRFINGRPERLTPDRAIGLDELYDEIKKEKSTIFVVGDGAVVCYNYLKEQNLDVLQASETVRFQRAWGVARAAQGKTPISAANLTPIYLRLSQAERERLERLKK